MVSGSSAFQASCVSGKSPKTSRFYLSKETFLRYLAPEEMFFRRWLIKALWTLVLRSGFFRSRSSLEIQETWILPLSNCSKVQQLPDGWLTTKFYWRNHFLRRSSFLSESFIGKKIGIVKEARNLLSFWGVVFRICQDPQNCLELFF